MLSEPLPAPIWISTPDELQRLAGELSCLPRLAVDTESNSLHAYRERVCLIQFSNAEKDYLVDPLALGDLSPLSAIFANPRIEKVFHAAEYDLICMKRDFGFRAVNLFDTMQSARILGYQQVGLDALLARKFDLRLDKRYQKADWGQRPLPEALKAYARLDTHHLLALRDLLEIELEAKGFLSLARDDFALACQVEEHPNGRAVLWQRAGRQYRLSPRQQTVLSYLCQARDKLAQRYDRPVFKIVSDVLLVELARRTPKTGDGLFAAGMTSRQVERFGRELLAAIRQGGEAPLVRLPDKTRPDPAFMNRLNALSKWRRQIAQELELESDVILPRRFLEALAENPPHTLGDLSAIMQLSPWRFERFGGQIMSVLAR